MTPFGQRARELRAQRGVSMKEMAEGVGVSPAYLSALEHGHRGRPSWDLLQRIITYFNVIWDEAEELEELARLSHPRAVINTAGLPCEATELANRLARDISHLDREQLKTLIDQVKRWRAASIKE